MNPADFTEDSAPITRSRIGHGQRGTAAFDKALERAFHQGRGHITALPADEAARLRKESDKMLRAHRKLQTQAPPCA